MEGNLTLLGTRNDAPLVYVSGGTLIMNQGVKISGNTYSSSSNSYTGGGGVYVFSGTFIMNGGEISGNTASSSGGGVYVNGPLGIFTMSGGILSGNTATAFQSYGGGVYVSGSKFTKLGGTITGYSSDTTNGNVVKNSSGVVQDNMGHAVYAGSSRRRETTAGPGVTLDANRSGAAGGWEN